MRKSSRSLRLVLVVVISVAPMGRSSTVFYHGELLFVSFPVRFSIGYDTDLSIGVIGDFDFSYVVLINNVTFVIIFFSLGIIFRFDHFFQ